MALSGTGCKVPLCRVPLVTRANHLCSQALDHSRSLLAQTVAKQVQRSPTRLSNPLGVVSLVQSHRWKPLTTPRTIQLLRLTKRNPMVVKTRPYMETFQLTWNRPDRALVEAALAVVGWHLHH